MDYISTDFGADSLSRFPFRAQTDRKTHRHKLTDASDELINLASIRAYDDDDV